MAAVRFELDVFRDVARDLVLKVEDVPVIALVALGPDVVIGCRLHQSRPTDRGEILYLSRDYDRAIAQVRGVLEMEPNFLQAHYILVFSLVQKGLFAEALADLEQWRGSDETPWSLMMDAYIHGRAGQQAQARRALQELERLRQRQPMDPAPLLLAHLGMGNTEAAFTVLDEAYSEHSTALPSLRVNPIYDPIRDDPRFESLDATHWSASLSARLLIVTREFPREGGAMPLAAASWIDQRRSR